MTSIQFSGQDVPEIELGNSDKDESKTQMIPGSQLSPNTRSQNKGVNEILPCWEYLVGYEEEEKAFEDLKLKLSENPDVLWTYGTFGETILHFALLMHRKLAAKWLIDKHGRLRDMTYGTEDDVKGGPNQRYRGEGCLHIIIINRDFDLAVYLLQSYHRNDTKIHEMGWFEKSMEDNGYPINKQRAIGDFFKKTGDNSVYYGETALDFAVSTNQIDMVNLLMGYSKPTADSKGKFNGKWRASMRLRDSFHFNSIFHICALKGHTEMWYLLTDHFMDTVANLSKLDRREAEVELEVQRRVGSMLNKYGLTPIQVAAYKNDKKMVEVILNQIRLKLYKCGEEGFYVYPLNEVDEYFKSPTETPGIPVNNIILCEGHSELVGITLIDKLMRQKWLKFGQHWVVANFIIQLGFCILVTYLFRKTYPDLENLEKDWGKVTNWQETVVYICVFTRVVYQIIRSIVEMVTIAKENFALQCEILRQNDLLRSNTSSPSPLRALVDSEIRANLNSFEIIRKSFSVMLSVYFEADLAIPNEFQNMGCKNRAHGSVTGFFNAIGLISNIAFIIAQAAALFRGVTAARVLLITIIIIMICEYVLLFLWLQTNRKIGRFLLTVVIILQRDILGFAVVFVLFQLVFTICFLFLAKEDAVAKKWLGAYFIWYELSIGSGEWFKDKLDTIESPTDESNSSAMPGNTDEGNFIDPYRRTLLYLTYMIYISVTIVVLMNLLIAIMSETASTLTKQMTLWEKNIKLSSVSLISRRLRASFSIGRFFGFRFLCFSDKWDSYTIGGRAGKRSELLGRRLQIGKDKCSSVSKSMLLFDPEADQIDLFDYFSQIRYWEVVVHEGMDIDKDGRKSIMHDDVVEEACKVMNKNLKKFFHNNKRRLITAEI